MDMKKSMQLSNLFDKLFLLEKQGLYSDNIYSSPTDKQIGIKHSFNYCFATNDYDIKESIERKSLELNTFGIIQSQAIIPSHYLDQLTQTRHCNEYGLSDFIDMFLPRLTQLKYISMKKKKPYLGSYSGSNPNWYQLALSGFSGYIGTAKKDGLSLNQKCSYSNICTNKNVNAENLKKTLMTMFNCKVKIVENYGHWISTNKDERTKIGSSNNNFNRLGYNILLGTHVWNIQNKILIELGPMSIDMYNQLLPDHRTYDELVDFLEFYVPDNINYEIKLSLKKQDIKPISSSSENKHKLGINTWLVSAKCTQDKQNLTLGVKHANH
jgi:type VI secretion system protein ImpH